MSIRQYGREDVDFSTWYSQWSKNLARTKTRQQLESMLGLSVKEAERGASAHLRAIEATGSMTGSSQRRAQTGNVTAAAGDKKLALAGALEIYDLFPEHTKDYHDLAAVAGEMRAALQSLVRSFGRGAMAQRQIVLTLDSPCVERAVAALARIGDGV